MASAFTARGPPCSSLSINQHAIMSFSRSLPVARSGVVWVKLPDGAVLFNSESEVYYGMNAVAAVVWEAIPQAAGNLDVLCGLIQERFPDATSEQVRGDVIALLDEMESAGLVEVTEAQSAA